MLEILGSYAQPHIFKFGSTIGLIISLPMLYIGDVLCVLAGGVGKSKAFSNNLRVLRDGCIFSHLTCVYREDSQSNGV